MATLAERLVEVWEQSLRDARTTVEIDGHALPVGRTRTAGLRIVAFTHGAEAIDGIEQNPEKTSRWAEMARAGQRIMQYRCRGRFFANVCEGRLTRYPAWKSLGLPE